MNSFKLRWGIMGCAKIARKSVIPGIQQSDRGVVAAIASRSEMKARETAAQLGIPKYYGNYEELLADESIDVVYIPLPNNMHKEWVIRAAEAGKHVLCEKPFAMNAGEAEEMVQACERAGVKLAEAFMYRHHPRYNRIREIVESGEIGFIRGIHGTFTYNNAADLANFRNSKELGGGAIYDIGVYPISAARYILGTEPEAATVHAMFSEQHGDVDMMASGLLEFPNKIALTFDCAMWADYRNTLEILGSDGRIEIPSAFVAGPDKPSHFNVIAGGVNHRIEARDVNPYSEQADDLAAAILDGKPQKFAANDAIHNMRVVDACLKSARTRTRVLV